jgi:hypothetical protein
MFAARTVPARPVCCVCWPGCHSLRRAKFVGVGSPSTKQTPTIAAICLFFGHQGALKEDLTALENLSFAAAMDGADVAEDNALAALYRFGLKGREDLPVRVLSAGQKRRVMLARLATRNAKLWVLDEPFTALDVKAVDLLATLICRACGRWWHGRADQPPDHADTGWTGGATVNAMFAIIRRDLLMVMRRKSEVLTALFFFVIVSSLFPLGHRA